MYDEDGTGGISLSARQSRIVNRRDLLKPQFPASPPLPPEDRYGPEFWDRLIRQPSIHTLDVPGAMYSYPAWRTDTDWSSLPFPGLEDLPSPSQLSKSRRKKKSDRMGTLVQQHIQELKRRQSVIEQLKSPAWGGNRFPEFEEKKEAPSMVDGFDPDDEGSVGFFESLQDRCRMEDSPFLKLSPPHSTTGVAFPWTASLDHISSFMEGQQAADRRQDRFPEANLFAENNGKPSDCESEYGSLEGFRKRNSNLKNWGTAGLNLDSFREGDSELEDWGPARSSPEGFGAESIRGTAGEKWGALWSSYKRQEGSTVVDDCLEEVAPLTNNWMSWRAGGRNHNRWEAGDMESEARRQSSGASFMNPKGWGGTAGSPPLWKAVPNHFRECRKPRNTYF
ncbi:protein INCA1 [Hyperolius riggenbachi]|uniref:protein INCA1 n=1 Tax=Hyperolius riggenbachi TaxID=752182 RepID=UPI0035A3A73B